MLYPSIVLDNFFTDPDLVVDFASKLNYYKDIEGRWPGERSEMLHVNYHSFFDYVNKKMLKAIYPNEEIEYAASTTFQKISGKRYPNEGWIHKDPDELTGIVYLSKHKFCGTSLCTKISFEEYKFNQDDKHKFYKKDNYDHEELKSLQKNNQYFKKTLTVDSEYNRLFLFDSSNYHMANSFVDENVNTDRMTLISFIKNIKGKSNNLKYGVAESRRLD
jgi:hypothetical protein